MDAEPGGVAREPRPQRLRDSSDFRRARERGRCWSDRYMVLCTYPNRLASARVGYAVSKRVGKAVQRNRVKRLLRESVRAYGDLVSPGWDIVLIARPRISAVSYHEIERSVGHLLGQAGVFRSTDGACTERTECQG